MGKLLQMLEKWMGGGPEGTKRVQTFRWLLIIGLAGVCIMILNSFLNIKPIGPTQDDKASLMNNDQETFVGSPNKASPFQEYEEKYEAQLKEILEKIVGVSQVEVLVTIDSTEEIVVYRNVRNEEQVTEEQDGKGGSRHMTDVSRSGDIVLYEVSGEEQPIVLKRIKPKVRGVIVVAGGAENMTVSKLIREAVSRGLDVPSHRITIAPRKQQ